MNHRVGRERHRTLGTAATEHTDTKGTSVILSAAKTTLRPTRTLRCVQRGGGGTFRPRTHQDRRRCESSPGHCGGPGVQPAGGAL